MELHGVFLLKEFLEAIKIKLQIIRQLSTLYIQVQNWNFFTFIPLTFGVPERKTVLWLDILQNL